MSEIVLLTGATGFIGGRLLPALEREGVLVRCLVRIGEQFAPGRQPSYPTSVVHADLLQPETLSPALKGVHTAYYLVHSMGGRNIAEIASFAQRDRQAATNFLQAAEQAGVQRIIYLGGLGETGPNLSEHLTSRQEVARILRSGKIQTTVLRAAVIIGAGGASFEMVRYLMERLPIMLTPRWVNTRCQPIAVQNVIEYLVGCLRQPATARLTLDIGGPDIVTYRDMMMAYARVRRLRRWLIPVPCFTPTLSAYWVNMITPVPAGVVYPLVEGLKNEVICQDNRIRDLVPIELISISDAIRIALDESSSGPGARGRRR
jgi:uncharacterized protein YbjT (DUF2867 family)